jgi:hypothetical protein
MKFYQMGNGKLIDAAGRPTDLNSRAFKKMIDEQEWTQRNGGICGIVEYTEPHAIYFASMTGNNLN